MSTENEIRNEQYLETSLAVIYDEIVELDEQLRELNRRLLERYITADEKAELNSQRNVKSEEWRSAQERRHLHEMNLLKLKINVGEKITREEEEEKRLTHKSEEEAKKRLKEGSASGLESSFSALSLVLSFGEFLTPYKSSLSRGQISPSPKRQEKSDISVPKSLLNGETLRNRKTGQMVKTKQQMQCTTTTTLCNEETNLLDGMEETLNINPRRNFSKLNGFPSQHGKSFGRCQFCQLVYTVNENGEIRSHRPCYN